MKDDTEITFNLFNDFICTSDQSRMSHGTEDMDGISPLQSSQEAVLGARTCKYQFVLFLICLFIVLDFTGDLSGHQGESQVVNMHNELEGKEAFQVTFPYSVCPQHQKIELAFYLKGKYHELHISLKLVFCIGYLKYLFLKGIFNVLCYFVAKGKQSRQN